MFIASFENVAQPAYVFKLCATDIQYCAGIFLKDKICFDVFFAGNKANLKQKMLNRSTCQLL